MAIYSINGIPEQILRYIWEDHPSMQKNIALVLDRKTGYVSAQFYVEFDEHFMIAKDFSTGSEWQLKTGLFQQESSKVL